MAKAKKYLIEADKYNWMLDRCEFTIFTNLNSLIYGINFKNIDLGYGRAKSYSVPGLIGNAYLNYNRYYYVFSYTLFFNFNFELRKHFKEELDIYRIHGVTFAHKENFIPCNMRQRLKSEDVSISQMRHKGYDLFFTEVDRAVACLSKVTDSEFDIVTESHDFQLSFRSVEVCNDIFVKPGIELLKNRQITSNFKQLVSTWDEGSYVNNTSIRTISEDLETEQLEEASWKGGDSEEKTLSGKYSCGSTQKFYPKERCRLGNIFRLERSYPSKKVLNRHLDSLLIRDRSDFEEKVNSLAEVAFESHMEIASTEEQLTRQEKWRLLKAACKEYYRHYWEDAYLTLKGKGHIYTGSDGSVHKGLARKTLLLARANTLVRKKANTRAVYEVDWNWVLHRKIT